MWGSLFFSILSLPFTKYFTCQPKAAACFVSCPELKGRWAQEKQLEVCRGMRGRRQKGKTTDWLKEKLKTDAMPEMLKWNHSSVFPLTFQPPQSVNRYKLFGYLKIQSVEKSSRWSEHLKQRRSLEQNCPGRGRVRLNANSHGQGNWTKSWYGRSHMESKCGTTFNCKNKSKLKSNFINLFVVLFRSFPK